MIGDWRKIKTNRTLFVLAIYSFVVTAVEGFLYFGTYEDVFFRVLLTLQNTIKAFTFKTTISLEAARSFMLNDPTPLKTLLGYAYMLAVFIAPYCTIAAIYKVLEKVLRLNAWFRRADKKDRILIFGYNEMTRKLLEKVNGKEPRIHVVCDKEVSSEERYKLLTSKIQLHTFDLLKAKKEDIGRLLQDVEIGKVTKVLLFEDDSVRNFSLLQTLGNMENSGLAEGAKIFCRCEDEGVYRLIEDYYDAEGRKESRGRFDLEIFDLYELQVRQMYENYPLHSYWLDRPTAAAAGAAGKEPSIPRETPDKWRLHLLILGFGKLGQQALLQAMNLGVSHSGNEIWIDVVDENIEKKQNIFFNHFATTALAQDEAEPGLYRVNEAWADGSLAIRFHKMDVRYGAFREKLEKLAASPAGGFTYVIAAMDQLDAGVRCASELRRFLRKNDEAHGMSVPILLRMDSDHRLRGYIEGGCSGSGLDGVRIIPDSDSILDLGNIFGVDWDDAAKKCNVYYANMSFDAKGSADAARPAVDPADNGQAEETWQRLTLFRRNSNRAAAYHNMVLTDVLNAKYDGKPSAAENMEKIFTGGTALIERKNNGWSFSLGDEAFLKRLDGAETLSEEYAFALEMLKTEHRRWCYYMISAGWEPPTENGRGVQKNDELCVNPCLVPWDKLTEYQPETCKYDLMPLMAEYEKE